MAEADWILIGPWKIEKIPAQGPPFKCIYTIIANRAQKMSTEIHYVFNLLPEIYPFNTHKLSLVG